MNTPHSIPMKQSFFAGLLAAALCLAAGPARAADNLTMADFGHSIKLMVDGYTGSETLENFPVLVRVSEAGITGFRYADMSAKNVNGVALGYDLAFFAEDGTRLACERDTWDASGTSLVWVALPSMAKGTKFWMCYNVADGVMVENPNPWGDYVGVWHLKEEGRNPVINDSTTNVLNGKAVATGDTGGSKVDDGAIGRARRIATNNFHAPGIIIDATNGVKSAVADSLGTDFHASFWMRAQGKVTYSYLLGRRRGDNGASWGVQLENGDPPSKVRLFSGGVLGENSDNDCVLTDDGVGTTLAEKTSSPRTWKKVDVIWKDATNGGTPAYDFYINGEFVESKNLKMAVNTNEHANIGIGCSTQDQYSNKDSGNPPQKGRRLNGDMDEVRLRPGIVSADWIKADYETVTNEQFLVGPKTITWDVGTNGGTMDVGGATVTTSTNTVPLDFVPAAPGTPVKPNAVFVGWNTIPTATTVVDPAGFVASAPLTFYAIFADAVVRWFAADGTTPLDPAVTAVAASSQPMHANPPTPPSTLYDRYTFEGWTRVDGDGSTVYATAELPTVSAGDDVSYKAVFSVVHSDDPDPSMLGFGHFAALKVAGYTGSAPVGNFPVLVRLSETAVSGFLYSDLTSPSDGADLAFFDAGGYPIPFEIDTWNPGGESLVWVRLPSMQNGTRFTIWWGSSEVTGKSVCPDDPWSDYTGVWHLNESGTGTSVVVHDATTNRLDGAPAHASSSAAAAGAVGGARFVTSSDNNSGKTDTGVLVDLSSDAAKRAAVDAIVPEFSASMWIRPQNSSTRQSNFEYLISRRAADKGPGWGAQFDEKSSRFSPLRVYSNEETDKDDDGLGNPAGTKVSTGASAGLAYQEWHKVDVAWTSDGKYKVFVDGAQTSSGTLAGGAVTNSLLSPATALSLGGSAAPVVQTPNGDGTSSWKNGRGFYGDMDEVRLRPGALTADRALADFETVTNRDFLVNDVLTIAWSDASGTTGFEHIGARSAVVGGAVSIFGLADSCDVEAKIWAAGGVEPATWTTLTNGIDALGAFSVPVTGLSIDTTYNYVLRAVGNDGETSKTVSGSFATLPTLTVAWSSTTASAGLSKIALDYVTASGSVAALGDATACDIQAKVWLSGDPEPESWTTVAEGLAQGDSFSATIRETSAGGAIAPGTSYAYALRGIGDNGETTTPVAGTFTTQGEAGEEIGSEWTHFFDDGTNAYWVANGFERYLQFTVTGYTGTETLTNFPVLVDVRKNDTNGFKYEDFYRADGSDMAFVDETGHLIPHEIDTWGKNMSLIWVRLPRMVKGTTFTMCYRSPLLDPLPDVGNTFEKYVGVWHMNEKEDGVVNLKDSTVNDFETETHAASKADSNGRIGYARRVAVQTGSASSYGRIIAFDHDDILRTGVGNVFTFSGFYKLLEKPAGWAYLVSRKSEDIDVGWGVQYEQNDYTKLRVWSGSSEKNKHQMFNTPGAQATGWNYWTFIFDGSVNPDGTTNQLFHAYLNGEELSSTEGGFQLNYPVVNDERATYKHLCVVGQENGTGAFNGLVDEARYSKGARSADWIKAEYASMLQVNTPFVTKGTNVGKGPESLVPVVVWEKGDGLPDTIVDVSYAYVQFAGTVTFCGTGADECRVEYQLWAEGEEAPSESEWTVLVDHAVAGTAFSIPVTGLKQDMPYNFRIRAVNDVGSGEQANREQAGSFRTIGNVNEVAEGELLRVDNKFVHKYVAGSYTFTTPDYVTNVEIMVVGGGGAGGYKVGGGGGGGGLFYSESFPVTTSTVYRIQVGQGGNAASNLTARSGDGEISYFARVDGPEEEDEVMLIQVPGGGGGGSYVNNETLAVGADGASGGGGTYAKFGGTAADDGAYGNDGGRGNDYLKDGSKGKVAAGGGGGAGREGTGATFDLWSTGGSGGVGVGCSMTGEELFYGAGGGGGYIYRSVIDKGTESYTRPGQGGSGIGGDAADVRNGTPATSGIENTGAGGGGGSAVGGGADNIIPTDDDTYWRGGDGGDGVVLIAYEVHGRDPISEDPRITMTRCAYNPDEGDTGTGLAEIDYRAYWAGIQAATNDVYVLYNIVGEEDVAAGNGERILITTGAIGVGSTTFVPPEVGHTYWIRLMARKDASSYMYSDEIASFFVPAVTLNGATWKGADAEVDYKLHDLASDSHLYCYWSESRALLEGDSTPSGDGVHFLDLGTGMSGATKFTIPASEGIDKTRVYYIRLASGDDGGIHHHLSAEIVELSDSPSVTLSSATWANQVATVGFTANPTGLDPADTELVALYSLVQGDVKADKAVEKESVTSTVLGLCSELPSTGTASFPLWSDAATNVYVRLALHSKSGDGAWWYSPAAAVKTLSLTATIPNALYVFANAKPKKGAYGDTPLALDYEVTYGGVTNGPGWDHRPDVLGSPGCAVTSASEPGIYDITNESVRLSDGTAWTEEEADPLNPSVTNTVNYQYVFAYVGAPYTVTNAQFSVTVSDTTVVYTGEPFDTNRLVIAESGVRNNQTVSYLFRVGSGPWSSTFDTSFSNIWTHIVQFKASATNHDDAIGTFSITIDPAPLTATISAANTNYTGSAQVPIVTTNVTGLVHPERNPLTCEFRDDTGEWQAEVPSFTQPGTYTLWFRASAPNHATAVTNCTFTVAGWEFLVEMDDGSNTTIRVTDPGWFIRNSPYTGDELADNGIRYAALNARCANGLKLWQNYVIEREVDDALVAAIHQACERVTENHFEIRFPNVSVLRNTGLDVAFRLDRKLAGEAAFSEGALSDKYEMNVPLGPSGLYVFNIVLSTTNDVPSRAVLASCATAGVLRVTSSATNLVAAVPWMSMASTNPQDEPVEVSETVNPNGISAGDRILAYNTASNFQGWAHASGTTWNPIPAGESDGVAVVTTNTTRFARGGAFWLVRTNPGECFYLVGRYTGDEYTAELAGGTAAAPGYTLVANPTMSGVALNALAFVDGSGDPATPADGDRIVLQDTAGFQKFYVRNAANTEWGRYVSGLSDGRVTQSWESGAAVSIPSGTGFWYVRTDQSPLFIRFGGAQ